MKHLILTSTSEVKVAAVKEVFPAFEIIAIKTPTEIEQPFGHEQALYCARRRVNYVDNMLLSRPLTGLPIMSIESGLVKTKHETYSDFVTVFVESTKGEGHYQSAFLPIPPEYTEYVEEAEAIGFLTITFGEVLNGYFPSIPKDNWQGHLCGVSRKDQIKQVLKLAEDLL